jgi:hypothetical protein
MEHIMTKQRVGSRIATHVLAVFGLVLAAMMAGEAGELKTSVALVSEDGVAVASMFPHAPKVSPFLAMPALEALLTQGSEAAARSNPFRDHGEYDLGCSPSLVEVQNLSDTEWYIYTEDLWDCMRGVASSVSSASVISWNWGILETDGYTPLVSCGTVWNVPVSSSSGGGCSVNYFDYFEYECVGDEQFVLNYRVTIGVPYYHVYDWTGPLFVYDVPKYGCAY